MTKRTKQTKLPPFLGLTVEQAAERLGWHMEAGGKENVSPHVCAVAWALSVLPLSPRERAEFLRASGMKEKPTPQGMMLVADEKPLPQLRNDIKVHGYQCPGCDECRDGLVDSALPQTN